jgi:hypothetical protein
MTALDFLAIVFATGAIIDVWHNGSIFAKSRAIIEAKNSAAGPESFNRFWTELFICSFCKSYHIPIYLYVFLYSAIGFENILGGLLPWSPVGSIVSTAARILIYGFAATRISNIIDGLLPDRMRYDRASQYDYNSRSRED